jgi:peptidoglycan/LPS O-acetylase OafA/YrhL
VAEEGYSYNGASWSIATEVFAYVAFFAIAYRWGKAYVAAAAAAAIVALTVYKARLELPFANETMARTMVGFFLGSLLFLLLRRTEAAGSARMLGAGAAIGLVLIAILAHTIGYDAFVGGSGFRTAVPHTLTLFPLVVLASLHAPLLSRILSIRPLTYLGDISYSVYLLHVPLQMIALSYLRASGQTAPTDRPWFLVSFLGTLLCVAAVVHRYFEVPARAWLRHRLLGRGGAPADQLARAASPVGRS